METFLREIRGSVTDLITRKRQYLDSMTIIWIHFRIQIYDPDGNWNLIDSETIDQVFNSRMMEVFQGSDFNKLLEEMFAHMRTQVENSSLTNS